MIGRGALCLTGNGAALPLPSGPRGPRGVPARLHRVVRKARSRAGRRQSGSLGPGRPGLLKVDDKVDADTGSLFLALCGSNRAGFSLFRAARAKKRVKEVGSVNKSVPPF